MIKMAVDWTRSTTYVSFDLWLEHHSSSLASLTQWSLSRDLWDPLANDWVPPLLCHLPCPQLRQIHLEGLEVQLEAAGGLPGVLHDCSSLTALGLWECDLEDACAACAAIAALPELQSLQLQGIFDAAEAFPMPQLQCMTKLTQLSICGSYLTEQTFEELGHLSQLSALCNLESLELSGLPPDGVPGGLPSQLSKLTYLSVEYTRGCADAAQFRHLSSLTALRDLSVKSWRWADETMPPFLDMFRTCRS
jgi:hypothetical protein